MCAVESSLLKYKRASSNKPARRQGHYRDVQQIPKTDIAVRVSSKDVCRLTRQLATLLRAGMPLVPALSALTEQLKSSSKSQTKYIQSREKILAEIVEQVRDSVNAGSSLADALSQHPVVFSPLFVNMAAAGQASGTLEEILIRLADILEKRLHIASKVKSAIAYPLMMTVVATGVVVFLMSYVVPSITQIFLDMNQALPWPTRILISVSNSIKAYTIIAALTCCAAILAVGTLYRSKQARSIIDHSKLKLPLFGKLILKVETARLTRTLGTLLVSGIPILRALDITKGVIQNSFVASALDRVRDSVSKGEALANAARTVEIFPPVVFHIIATGQLNGNIEQGLINIADMYDDEVEIAAKTLTSLLEPAILLIMGMVVGFIVLAILLPIFEINQLI